MKTRIVLLLMALALLLAAHAQTEQPAVKPVAVASTEADEETEEEMEVVTETERKVAAPTLPDILYQYQRNINTNDVLTIGRNGHKVVIKWAQDFSACKGISILRNNTGLAKNRRVIAKLPADSKEFMDIAPDTHAYWYWIVVDVNGKKSKRIGPIRAKSDFRKKGNYSGASKDFVFSVQRDQSSVVVVWDLPEGKYQEIIIRRRNKPDFLQGRNHRTFVRRTTERSGNLTDKLPDSNADYWYWIDATREDGLVISKGPIKAEFGAK